jgi:NAD(P)H-dependent FMN reductase
MWAQQDLRKVLGIAGARVIGEPLPVARAHERDLEADETLRDALRDVLEALVLELAPDVVAA